MRGVASLKRASMRSPDVMWLLAASAVSGFGGYGFQVLVAQRLGPVRFASIGVIWTVIYLAVSVALSPLEAYAARKHVDLGETMVSALPDRTVLMIVATTSALLAVSALDGPIPYRAALASLTGVAVVSYALFFWARGILAGGGRFHAYAWMTAEESLLRLGLAFAVLLVSRSALAVAATMVLGPIRSTVSTLWEHRPHGPRRADPGIRPYLRHTTAPNAMAQFLLAGGPVVLSFLDASEAEITVLFAAFTTARVPLVFALNGLAARILPTLRRLAITEAWERFRRAVGVVVVGSTGAAVAGAALAWWLGPPFLRITFALETNPEAWLPAIALASTFLATGALLSGYALVAMSGERYLFFPWSASAVVAACWVLFADGGPSWVVATATLIGQATALAGISAILVLKSRSSNTGLIP